jgi:CheY-like chemotaxis protein/HPt (histidine-containing phosphotransfer) domain-containing protein
MNPIHAPRLLLVEDDPTSQAFLRDALLALPANVDVAGDIAEARALAQAAPHALWIVDAHLPDGDGLDCLRVLRLVGDTPALAITAGGNGDAFDALCAGGFLEVLAKPVPLALLQATVRRLVGDAPRTALRVGEPGKLPVWDEARALAAIGGNPQALLALRGLFLGELPAARSAVEAAIAAGDGEAARAHLHKLQAGAGFVGAARLSRAIRALSGAPLDAGALEAFTWAVEDIDIDGMDAGAPVPY